MRIRVLTSTACPAAPLGYRHLWRLRHEAAPFLDARDSCRIWVPSLQKPRRPSVRHRRCCGFVNRPGPTVELDCPTRALRADHRLDRNRSLRWVDLEPRADEDVVDRGCGGGLRRGNTGCALAPAAAVALRTEDRGLHRQLPSSRRWASSKNKSFQFGGLLFMPPTRYLKPPLPLPPPALTVKPIRCA